MSFGFRICAQHIAYRSCSPNASKHPEGTRAGRSDQAWSRKSCPSGRPYPYVYRWHGSRQLRFDWSHLNDEKSWASWTALPPRSFLWLFCSSVLPTSIQRIAVCWGRSRWRVARTQFTMLAHWGGLVRKYNLWGSRVFLTSYYGQRDSQFWFESSFHIHVIIVR